MNINLITRMVERTFPWLAGTTALSHVYFNTFSTLSELRTSALHFGMFGLLVALTKPGLQSTKMHTRCWVLIVDVLIGALAMACAIYVILAEDAFYNRGQNFIYSDWIFSGLAIVIVLELTRRTTGWLIPILALVALSYIFLWGQYIPGVFRFPGLSLETTLYRSFYGGDGMFGPIARISWSFVFMFVLFGAFLVKSGAGDFIINLARATAGRLRGGPGFVAVLGSGLMGSISGSAVGNTVSTGAMTIPLMKRSGFTPRFAAGVEAAASTGGQLMPPVMGAGAFIMANYTQTSYVTIITAALLPAILYFLSVGFYVRIEAVQPHTTQIMDEEAPSASDVLSHGWPFIIPVLILVTLLVYGFTPTWAAGVSILTVVGVSWLGSRPMHIKDIADALIQGSLNAAVTAVLLVAVGLIVMAVTTTGLGNTFSQMIIGWAGGSLLLTLILVAIASLVLGMGLPVTAAYVVLAPLTAPALTDLILESRLIELVMAGTLPESARTLIAVTAPSVDLSVGVSANQAAAIFAAVPPELHATLINLCLDPAAVTTALLSAHMIVFWLSQDSNVTPPVCLTAFAAAAIAGTRPIATGFTAWKISKGLYIIPIVMAYGPLIGGDGLELARLFFLTTLGLYAFSGTLQGALEGPLTWVERFLLLAATILLLIPQPSPWLWGAGIAIVIGLVLLSRRRVIRQQL